MDIVTEALVTKVADYGDSDKMLTLLTADLGKISANAKGVRKAGAKLKFAAQPFSFGQYTLASKGSRYTVTGCSQEESFFELVEDMEKMYAASAACAVANLLDEDGGQILAETLKCLEGLCAGDKAAVLRFVLRIMDLAGYPVSCERCPVCGKSLFGAEKTRFDSETGAFCCYDCSAGFGVRGATRDFISAAARGEKTGEDKETLKRAMRLAREYLGYRLDIRCPQLDGYIDML